MNEPRQSSNFQYGNQRDRVNEFRRRSRSPEAQQFDRRDSRYEEDRRYNDKPSGGFVPRQSNFSRGPPMREPSDRSRSDQHSDRSVPYMRSPQGGRNFDRRPSNDRISPPRFANRDNRESNFRDGPRDNFNNFSKYPPRDQMQNNPRDMRDRDFNPPNAPNNYRN